MSIEFCHLHNHTEYSLLDGANRIPEMIAKASEMGMKSLAISDHGVMFGVMDFYWEAKKAGIKPILGMEAYVAPKGIHSKGNRGQNDAYHLLLLAKNNEGYRNLCKISSIAAIEGYYYKPRVDHEILSKYSDGIIATSTCLGSEVCQALLENDYEKARTIAETYCEIFGPENYYIELQNHGLEEQKRILKPLIQISKDLKLPLIATNDAHYLCKSDAKPHDVLLCIQTGSEVASTHRMKFETEEFYIKSPQEMAEIFKDVPEAIENTIGVAERCELNLEANRALMPIPEVPNGVESFDYLRQLAIKGLERTKDQSGGLSRLEYELDIIKKTGFGDYFLLVREFANATRERGIYFGVRGSAAGSLTSFCLGITDVDPIEYDLTFERFLNPERISMPDIDMDFEDSRRDEIIQYVQDRFGKDHVAQIVTFGTLGAKAAIRDCARVMGYPPSDADKLCKAIPEGLGVSIERALKEGVTFKALVDSDPKFKEIVSNAQSVEGITRHAGVHAAGVVITKDPLVEYVPLYRGNEGQPVTAFTMKVLEKLKLLKMDFLGLSNLTVLSKTLTLIESRHGIKVDLLKIPQDDSKTYEMLSRGETTGVFQLEGGGMTTFVKQLKANSVKDLCAMVALYRPGPMDHIPRFIDSKHGRSEPKYLHERMRPVLEETYGVIVYQDQVLKLVQTLSGFSLGKADVLRRAMGKKDAKALESMKAEFLEGGQKNDIPIKALEKIWTELEPFAGYAFNKAHAVCYGILAYQTAYLKANYTIEFMTALLDVYRNKEDRVTNFIEECRKQGITVLPPDINKSQIDFHIENDKCIRFGLAAIKGVGEGVSSGIIEEREVGGPFSHLYEFTTRTKPANVTKTCLEPLIKAGTFDSIDGNRYKLLSAVDGSLSYASLIAKEKLDGQDSLFGGPDESPEIKYPTIDVEIAAPTRSERLVLEKEVLGIYVSDHPLRGKDYLLKEASSQSCFELENFPDGSSVQIAGVLASVRITQTKRQEKMATAVLEDLTGQIPLVIFARTYERIQSLLRKDEIVKVKGTISYREDRAGSNLLQVRVEDMELLAEGKDENDFADLPALNSPQGLVTLIISKGTDIELSKFKSVLNECRGTVPICFVVSPFGKYPPIVPNISVDPTLLIKHKADFPYIEIKFTAPQTS